VTGLEWRPPKFNVKGKPVPWVAFFLDCRLNEQANDRQRLALGIDQTRTMASIMTTKGIKWKLAGKVGRAVAMPTAAYGIEAMWQY
jgi:hypothetical protein